MTKQKIIIKTIFSYLLLILGGFTLGSATIPLGVFGVEIIKVDHWESNWLIGTKQTNPYVRSYVSVFGLLGLPKTEAVYFNRSSDDEGRPLTGDCVYEMTGTGQAAQWWSITLYDDYGFFPMNDGQALSVDATDFSNSMNRWRASISQTPPDDGTAWISSQAADGFVLTLRLYKPSADLLALPKTVLNPPSVKRLSCSGE